MYGDPINYLPCLTWAYYNRGRFGCVTAAHGAYTDCKEIALLKLKFQHASGIARGIYAKRLLPARARLTFSRQPVRRTNSSLSRI